MNIYDRFAMPNLRATERKKYEKDQQWFKDFMNFHVPAATIGTYFLRDFEDKLRNYRLINNDIDYTAWKPVCDQLGITQEAFETNIYTFNLIPKIMNELVGEELHRNEVFTPVLLTQKDIINKEEQLKSKVNNYVDQVIQATINYAVNNMKLSGGKVEPAIVDQELERLRTTYQAPLVGSFLSETEIMANKIIKYAQFKTNFKQIKNECWRDVIIVDEEYVCVDVDIEPTIKRVNPLFLMYHKSPEVMYVQDGDWAAYTSPMSLYDVQKNYPELSEEDWVSVGINHGTYDLKHSKDIQAFHHDKYPDIDMEFFTNGVSMLWDINIGSYGTGNNTLLSREKMLPVTHIVWKAFKWVGYLDYYNEYGEVVTDMVDDTFKVPKEALKQKFINRWNRESTKYVWVDRVSGKPFSLEWVEIPTVYEGTRIGGNVFTRMREMPYQNRNIENPFNVKLPYKGRIINSMNARSISLVERMKPYNVLYMLTLNKFIDLIARYDGALIPVDTSQVDIAMGGGDPELAMENTLKWRKMGYYIYNSLKDAETGDNAINTRPAPPVINADSSASLLNLIKLLEWISVEIGMVVGVSPQRLAQMTSQNASDNQQALIQSSHITEPYFNAHNETWRNILTDYINLFITWSKKTLQRNPDKKEHFLNYILPDNTVETIKLTPDLLDINDLGVFTNLSSAAKEYYETMKQMSHALVQNDQMTTTDISHLLLGIMGGESPQEVHKRFEAAKLERQAREQALEKQRGEIQAQIEQQKQSGEQAKMSVEMQKLQFERDTKLMTIELQGNIDKEIAVINAYKFQEDLDADGDNIPDPIEAAKLQHQMNVDMAKLEIDKEKLENDKRSQLFEEVKLQEQSRLKEKDIAAKRSAKKN